ncbi:MAG: hypothetical protein RLZZ618_2545 [Pseudomonadota bacterium]|jgi:AraC-like DNA-binding protein
MSAGDDALIERPALRLPLSQQTQVHLFTEGYMFSCPGIAPRETQRIAASLLIALTDQDFELEVAGQRTRHGMVAIRPQVAHRLHACEVPVMLFDLDPRHLEYRRFLGIANPGVQAFARERFAGFAEEMLAFHAGNLTSVESQRLFRRAVNLAVTPLPAPPDLDPRVQQAKTLLDREPTHSIDDVAQSVGLSRDRLSTLFSSELGITLRLYAQSMKINAAVTFHGKGMTLTEIAAAAGFADSAHFSKVWSQTYGSPPGNFFSSACVTVNRTRTGRGVSAGRPVEPR